MNTERASKEVPSNPPNRINLDIWERGGECIKKIAKVNCSY